MNSFWKNAAGVTTVLLIAVLSSKMPTLFGDHWAIKILSVAIPTIVIGLGANIWLSKSYSGFDSIDQSTDEFMKMLSEDAERWYEGRPVSGQIGTGQNVGLRKTGELAAGTAFYTVPKEMFVGDTEIAELRLVLNPNKFNTHELVVVRGLARPERISNFSVDCVGSQMKAQMFSEDSKLSVRPLGNEHQHIKTGTPTHWDWMLQGKSSGETTVHLRLTITHDVDGNELNQNVPLHREVVRVRGRFVKQTLAEWKWLVATLLAITGTIIAALKI